MRSEVDERGERGGFLERGGEMEKLTGFMVAGNKGSRYACPGN